MNVTSTEVNAGQGVPNAGSDPRPCSEPSKEPKNIIVCSDGTGNTAIKGRGTNVFKLYEMLDAGAKHQEAFYDDGVGTQSHRFFAVLTGITGIGLGRNVRELYVAISKVYTPGSRIYMFGFSRGAFTVRALAGMINKIGLISCPANASDREWMARAKLADRQFRHNFLGRGIVQIIGAGLLYCFRRRYKEEYFCRRHAGEREDIKTHFVGVWDTVDAVGFPVPLVASLWNEIIYRFKFSETTPSKSMRYGAHALALDEQRGSFWPLSWDESGSSSPKDDLSFVKRIFVKPIRIIRESIWRSALIIGYQIVSLFVDEFSENKTVWRNAQDGLLERLKHREENKNDESSENNVDPIVTQAWFAGVHSNVGGGYPRHGLSLMAMRWMIKRVDCADLADRSPEHGAVPPKIQWNKRQQKALLKRANEMDRLYDSRSGVSVLYRFSPRPVNMMCVANGFEPLVHKSVLDRIKRSENGYAPANLPVRFRSIDNHNNIKKQQLVPQNGRTGGFRAVRQLDAFRKVLQILFWAVVVPWPLTQLFAQLFAPSTLTPTLEQKQSAQAQDVAAEPTLLDEFLNCTATFLNGLASLLETLLSLISMEASVVYDIIIVCMTWVLNRLPIIGSSMAEQLSKQPTLGVGLMLFVLIIYFLGRFAKGQSIAAAQRQWANLKIEERE